MQQLHLSPVCGHFFEFNVDKIRILFYTMRRQRMCQIMRPISPPREEAAHAFFQNRAR